MHKKIAMAIFTTLALFWIVNAVASVARKPQRRLTQSDLEKWEGEGGSVLGQTIRRNY